VFHLFNFHRNELIVHLAQNICCWHQTRYNSDIKDNIKKLTSRKGSLKIPPVTALASADHSWPVRQPADDVNHKLSRRLPLVSARPAVTFLASECHHPTPPSAYTNFSFVWWTVAYVSVYSSSLKSLCDSGMAENQSSEFYYKSLVQQHIAPSRHTI